jgi:LmbE family N-acetylglucosaminyl deacetylase
MLNMTHIYKFFFSATFIVGILSGLSAQTPQKWNAAELYQQIKKLNFLGSALYVAAHPDDENQRLISYLSNELNATTTYIAMTRGDGGQNEIGPEIRELLGVIRTQELLAARRIDGGNQHFSRMNDFGFSKNPEETLEKWGKEEALADMVWAIRKWQPDIIINRFQNKVAERWKGRMHGHHTASAMLSFEAFDLAARPDVYPGQLQYVQPWQPSRLFFNTSWWFYGSREKFAKADKSKLMSVDIGTYFPLLGRSNTEIAAAARSMHKAQGFGDMGTRGSQMEYLELLKGEMPAQKKDLFEGVNTSWSRLKGGAPIGALLSAVEKEYRFDKPSASVPKLLQAMKLIEELPDGFWKTQKLKDIKAVIQACLGLFLEAVAEAPTGTPGGAVELAIEAINRSEYPVTLKSMAIQPTPYDTVMNAVLEFNEGQKIFKTVSLPKQIDYTSAYWLKENWDEGRYRVDDQAMRGLPETPRTFRARFELDVDGTLLVVEKAVVYKYEDAVQGEVYQPFEITPPVFVEVAEAVYVFGNNEPQQVDVVVSAGTDNVKGKLKLDIPKAWKVRPQQAGFDLSFKGESQTIRFELFPSQRQSQGTIVPVATLDEGTFTHKMKKIDYPHIPVQQILLDASARVARVDMAIAGKKIGYIMGLGDEIPASLRQIGYQVDILNPTAINAKQLLAYDAIILGVRVYNGVEEARQIQPFLFEYVKQGGTLITQYNKNFGMTIEQENLAPYPLKISRDRVTVEEAPVSFLAPEHPVLNWPNKIGPEDFEGWVQERGLYFPNEWADEYTAILSSHDPEEPPRNGGLLIAQYGEGYYVYTAYSWFRQLPAGVPGAFRLFANMISLGQQQD